MLPAFCSRSPPKVPVVLHDPVKLSISNPYRAKKVQTKQSFESAIQRKQVVHTAVRASAVPVKVNQVIPQFDSFFNEKIHSSMDSEMSILCLRCSWYPEKARIYVEAAYRFAKFNASNPRNAWSREISASHP